MTPREANETTRAPGQPANPHPRPPETFLDWARERCPPGIALRAEREKDTPFLIDLYRSTREQELSGVDWPEAQKCAFVRGQYELQRKHYRLHYPGAEFLVVETSGQAAGRLQLRPGTSEVRLMEITLAPSRRAQGNGTALTRLVLDFAACRGLPVRLHVEPFNPALRLYRRLGFRLLEVRGIYQFMERLPEATPAPE